MHALNLIVASEMSITCVDGPSNMVSMFYKLKVTSNTDTFSDT